MGTSKGYIPPTNQKWRNAKRAVGLIGKSGYSYSKVQKAVKKYAEAYSETHLGSSSASIVAGNVLGFLSDINNIGFTNTIEKYGLVEFEKLKGLELYNALLNYFASNANTPDNQIVRNSLGDTLDKLHIYELKDLEKINSQEFLMTFLVEFVVKGFEECFAEKIIEHMDDLSKYEEIIRDVEQIVEEKIYVDQAIGNILELDFTAKSGKEYVSKIINDTFNVLKQMEVNSVEDLD